MSQADPQEARLDLGRRRRLGMVEAIWGEHKSAEQLAPILRDLQEISRVGVDPEDSEESGEQAYAELVEFVRVGVQLLFEQLEPLRGPAPPAGERLH